MINFFRPLHLPLQEPTKKSLPTAIEKVYGNSAGFFHDFKRTWQVLFPIPLRHFTSVLFDLVTLKTRPQELLMSDSEHFRECLCANIGDFTFQEAFDRTGRICNITGNWCLCMRLVPSCTMAKCDSFASTVTPNNSSDPPRLLNYLTAPHCLVWSAAVASSSLPGKTIAEGLSY